MASNKTQLMVLVEEDTLYRLDALRVVTRQSRARVNESALLDGGLPKLEITHARGLERLGKLAEDAGATVQEYVRAYAKTYARATYGVGLDALEVDDKAVRTRIKAARKPAAKAKAAEK